MNDPCTRWRTAFWAGVILGLFIGIVPCAEAEELWLGSTIASKHISPGREYNEEHWPSVFVEHHFDGPWSYQAGTYRNSFGCQTWYAMGARELWRWRFFALVDHKIAVAPAIGAGTGYVNCVEGRADPGLSPMLGIVMEWRIGKNLAINLFVNPAVVALQPKGMVWTQN